MKPQNDLSEFEAATIRDGARVDVVFRRKGPAILTRLSHNARMAVETYLATAEAVMAGGVSMPRSSITATGGTGTPSREGRQFGALGQVEFLRKMDKAVGRGVISIGKRAPASVPEIELWRGVVLADLPMVRFAARYGLSRSQSNKAVLNAGFVAIAERVALAIGKTKSPWVE